MRITGNPNVQKILQSYSKQVNKAEEVKKANKPNDKVEISEEARMFQLAMKALKEVPDVREDKVSELKEQIESGTYQPSSKEVASKILNQVKTLDK